MRGKSVNEEANFERGQDPKKTMEIGSKGFQVIFFDPDEKFADRDGIDLTGDLFMEVFTKPVNYEKAFKEYQEMKKIFGNAKLVQVWKE